MDVELKAKWVKALRSGDLEQTTGRLAHKHGYNDESFAFCCLGVLCEVAEINFTESSMSKHYRLDGDAIEGYTTLTRAMRETWGITEENQDQLINMNDTLGNSFDEIADYIEEYL